MIQLAAADNRDSVEHSKLNARLILVSQQTVARRNGQSRPEGAD
jgi:hypothetical protein